MSKSVYIFSSSVIVLLSLSLYSSISSHCQLNVLTISTSFHNPLHHREHMPWLSPSSLECKAYLDSVRFSGMPLTALFYRSSRYDRVFKFEYWWRASTPPCPKSSSTELIFCWFRYLIKFKF